MNRNASLIAGFSAILSLTGCDNKPEKSGTTAAPVTVTANKEDLAQREKDMPLLTVNKGDKWVYAVKLLIPAGVNINKPEEVNSTHEMVRTFIGTHQPSPDLKPAQCFEVTVVGSPVTREYVDIRDDVIFVLGSLVESEPKQLIWYANPVPFVVAGMKPGTSFPSLKTENDSITIHSDIIAREDVTVPAGTYPCIRLLITGQNMGIEVRKTLWYAPQHGIIREESAHYSGDKLIYRETQELARFENGP